MSESSPTDTRAAPWPSKETNSVTAAEGDSDDLNERVYERVNEFVDKYPELAELPLSETHGRKLRRIVTKAEWREKWVDPTKSTESAFQVTELDRREAATWDVALSAFLTAHVRYDGLRARFANDEGDEFEIPLADAWGEEYSKKQYARALSLQRQMGGGERPTGGEAVAAWDAPATAMITLTGSSVPDGERVPPVEHTDALHDSFSYDGVRDTLRNTMEYHIGLEPEQWGYWLQAEPHGLGASESDGPIGPNACYTHLHVGVYFDASGLDLDAVESELRRVVDKHVEVCDYASESAHRDAISVNAEVENMGSYLATYMGGYTESLLDKPIEYLAWGAIYWSAARRRTSRSKVLTAAIKADACEQRAEHEDTKQTEQHGESVTWNDGNGLDVVCASCGSGWCIDQTRLDDPVPDEELSDVIEDDRPAESLSFSDRWSSARGGYSTGELPSLARIRSQVLDYVNAHGPPESVPQLLGELGIDPRHVDTVVAALDGETEPASESFTRLPVGSSWRLDAIIDSDDEEHSPGGGGVDMKPLHLPVRHLLEETRLRHDLQSGEKWRCGRCNFATFHERSMAGHLHSHGLDDPEVADWVLEVESYHGNTRSCMQQPPKPAD